MWTGVISLPPRDFLLRTTMLINPPPFTSVFMTCFLSLLVKSMSLIFNNQSFTLESKERKIWWIQPTSIHKIMFMKAVHTLTFHLQHFLYPPLWQIFHSHQVNRDHLPPRQCQTQEPSSPCHPIKAMICRSVKLFIITFCLMLSVSGCLDMSHPCINLSPSLTRSFSNSTTSVSHSRESVSMAESWELCAISWQKRASFSSWLSIFSLHTEQQGHRSVTHTHLIWLNFSFATNTLSKHKAFQKYLRKPLEILHILSSYSHTLITDKNRKIWPFLVPESKESWLYKVM